MRRSFGESPKGRRLGTGDTNFAERFKLGNFQTLKF